MKKKIGETCLTCGKFVEGFIHKYCCKAFDCGCMGMPIEPCFCSEQCYDNFMKAKNEPNK
jgi:hypothetical protein